MADLPLFPFTTQEDWYGELQFSSAEVGNPTLSLAGRVFEMPITPSVIGASLVAPVLTLTMAQGGGLSLKSGDPSTIVFRVPKSIANGFARQEYTADVLEVVDGERHLFMPVRIRYSEPSGILSFISRFVGVAVSFSARMQPIISPVAITGRQGAAGATIVTGATPPVPANGKDGDFWIEDRTASGQGRRMYGPKASGAWPATPWNIQVAGVSDVPGLISRLAVKTDVLTVLDDQADLLTDESGLLISADNDPLTVAQRADAATEELRRILIAANLLAADGKTVTGRVLTA